MKLRNHWPNILSRNNITFKILMYYNMVEKHAKSSFLSPNKQETSKRELFSSSWHPPNNILLFGHYKIQSVEEKRPTSVI